MDDLQPLGATGHWFPTQPLAAALTRSRWAPRSSCRKSRRAPRTASGSRSGGPGEVTGPGDGGWDPGLHPRGLGLLSPSPLPRREDTCRDTGATRRGCSSQGLHSCPAAPDSPYGHPIAQRPCYPLASTGHQTPRFSESSQLLHHTEASPVAHPGIILTLYKLATLHHPQLLGSKHSLVQPQGLCTWYPSPQGSSVPIPSFRPHPPRPL